MSKADYYTGLNAHHKAKDEREVKQLRSEHGRASMHPMDTYRHSHAELDKPAIRTIADAHKLGKLKIIRKDKL